MRRNKIVSLVVLIALLCSLIPIQGIPSAAAASGTASPTLLITEIMAAPKAAGEPYEYVELYNTASQPIDLTGYQIHYYTNPALEQPWTDTKAKKWSIMPMDDITGGTTDMTIAPHSTKIVWLVKPQHSTYKVEQFIAEYDSALTKDQIVYAKLGANEGLDNAVQRYVGIVRPGGDPDTDRISMVGYNMNAGIGYCAYVPTGSTPACDYKKTATTQQSIIFFLPSNGLDAVSKMMERRTPDSLNQDPTPGKLKAGQEPLLPAEVLDVHAVRNGGQAVASWREPTDLGGKADYAYVNIYDQNHMKAAGPIAKGTTSAIVTNLAEGIDYTFTVVTVSSAGVESVGVKPGSLGSGSGITQEELGLRKTKMKVAAVGDSITRNTGTTVTYPQNLGKRLGPDYEVRNFGVSGTTLLKLGDSSYWNTPEFQQSQAWNPDIVVIMLGSNDSKPQNWQHKDQFVSDYVEMILQYKSLPAHPKVFVNLPPKVYGTGGFNITDAVVSGEVIPAIKEAARLTDSTVIDVYSATINMPEYFPDHVHPNDEGTKVIAKAVSDQLSKYYISYGDFNFISKEGPVIPGLKQGIIPQGAAYVPGKNWMLATYYRNDGQASGITVTDLSTGKFVKAMELREAGDVPYTGHAGGIAVSDENLWISSDSHVYRLPIQNVINAGDGDKLIFTDKVQVATKGSFVTYSDHILWVGEFAGSNAPTDSSHHMTNREQTVNHAWVAGYKLSSSDLLSGMPGAGSVTVPDYILSIPDEIQGMEVVGDKVVLSRSYGRNNDSRLLAYTWSLSEAAHSQTSVFGSVSVPIWFLDGSNILNSLIMPPMAEGIFEHNGSLHVLFESGAKEYLDGKYPIDKLQFLDAAAFLKAKSVDLPVSSADGLLITEIMAAPKAAGEPYEYVELYNHSDQPVDLTGYQIHYYTNPGLEQPWTDPKAKKWSIVPMDAITGGTTNMTISPKETKIVWLVKPQHSTYKVEQFIAEYDPTLTKDQFVYAQLGANEGLDNAVQRYVAIVKPGGDPNKDRISMAAYNVNAGLGSCQYIPSGSAPACDFAKSSTSQQSIIYFYPAGGLDKTSKMMERRIPASLNQQPSPGKLNPGQAPGTTEPEKPDPGKPDPEKPDPGAAQAGTLLITEIMAAPKAVGEPYEYVELYNTTDQPIDLTGYSLHYYTNPGLEQPWTDTKAKKWSIVPMDAITGGITNMTISPKGTKLIWLVKPQHSTYKLEQFSTEYGSALRKDQIAYAKLGSNEGLENAVQRFVAIVGPGEDPAKDRISMAAYNVNAGTGGCQYVPSSLPACDFARSEGKTEQSVNYFYPEQGLDVQGKWMERRQTGSTNQTPTPGKIYSGQVPDFQAIPEEQSITLKWKPLNLNVSGYRVYQDGSLVTPTVTTVTYDTYQYKIGDLRSGTTYIFELAGVLKSVYGQETGETTRMFPVLVTTLDSNTIPIGRHPSSRQDSAGAKGEYVPPAAVEDRNNLLGSNAYTVTTGGNDHGQKVALIQVNASQLTEAFGKLTDERPFLALSYDGTESVLEVILPASALEKAKENGWGRRFIIYKNGISYEFPLAALQLETLSQKQGVSLNEMDIHITIAALPDEQQGKLRADATQQGSTLLTDAYEFLMTMKGNGKSIPLDDFGKETVTRALKLSGVVKPEWITGVQISSDGFLHFIPSTISEEADGNTYVKMKNSHNSVYAVAESKKIYEDIQGHWSQKDVEQFASKQILNGMAEQRFQPDTNVTRAEFAALLVNALGISGLPTDAGSESIFKDIDAAKWYAKPIRIAALKGLVFGYEGNLFKPDATITREEMAVMLMRALLSTDQGKSLTAVPLAFHDKDTISEWARDSVSKLVKVRMIEGMTEDSFVPAENATRAQAVTMVKRMLRWMNYLDN
ncbi:lamin tail domain-containing protein [Paenibacillus sp. UNC451MF]|uniref:lamin tail domain-containing protein n=1 Tax=Paenibacillus sp. UNC451MF TaxID=1449063 RepID=UPI00048E0054|nr:lamin tail domain-containing protein [Paenibacillus sp. UNC451MF]